MFGFIGTWILILLMLCPLYLIGHFLLSLIGGDYKRVLLRQEEKKNNGEYTVFDRLDWQIASMGICVLLMLLGCFFGNFSVLLFGIVCILPVSWICALALSYRKRNL